MKRFGLLALVAALAGAGGCASSAKYVEKKADSGVVAVPDDSNAWPNYNRQAALKLIEQHVGPDYEIVDQKTVKTGRQTRSSLPDTNETLNPRRPGSPGYQSSTHATSMPEQTQFLITYVRRGGTASGDAGTPGVPSGLVPAGGTVRTQYPPTGAAPNLQPAHGFAPGAMPSSFNRPKVAPAAGGADCDT